MKVLELVEIKQDEIKQYEDFNSGTINGDLLQSPTWTKIKDEWKSYFLAIKESEEIIAIATAMVRTIPYINKKFMYIPRGPVFKDYTNQELWAFFTKEIQRFAKQKKCIFIKIDPAIKQGTGIEKIIEKNGFKNVSTNKGFGGTQPKSTIRLDISPEPDQILSNMPKKIRYNINYPEKKGVEIKVGGIELLEHFNKVMEATSSRAGFLARPLEYYKNMLETLGEKACLTIAYYEKVPLAGGVTIAYGDKAWAMYGGAANTHTNLKAYYALNYKRMLWAKSKGAKYFDFFGIPVNRSEKDPLFGLYKFKKSFGGEEVDFIGEYDLVVNKGYYFIWKLESGMLAIRKKFVV